jgi:hypothetical protein
MAVAVPRRALRPVPALAARALATVPAGASPGAGVVAGPVRLLLIRFPGLAGWGVCVAGLGAVRLRG